MNINVENDAMPGRNNDSIYATKFYVMQKQINELRQENKQLKEQLLVAQTNEETFRLEMEDITKTLGLDEDTIFDDVKACVKNLKDNWNKLKELFDIQKGSEEYEALQWLEFQATNYKNDSIILHFYRILYNFILKLQLENKKFKKLKNNWEKLKEYIGTEWYCFDNESVEFEVAKNILNIMQEIEGSESNDTNR